MAHTSYKDRFIEILLENYNMCDWELSTDNGAQIVGYTNSYTIRIFHSREGYFLQAFDNDNTIIIHTLSEKEYPRIKELFKKVRDYIIDEEEDKFWQKICDLFNEG